MPRWRADGNEIVYLAPDRSFMSVPVSGSGPQFQAGTPVRLFSFDVQMTPGAVFDMTADGQRFIVNTAIPSRMPPSLVLITNWPSLLKK